MQSDIAFTAADLVDGGLVVPDTRIVELAVEDDQGRLVLPSMRYDGSATHIDLTGFEVSGIWHLRKVAVSSPEPEKELLRLFMLRTPSTPFSSVWSGIEQHYYASGLEQYDGNEMRTVTIPAYGVGRQHFRAAVRGYGEMEYEPVFYHFQIYGGNDVLYDVYTGASTLALSENLAYLEGDERPRYSWRVRTTDGTPDPEGDRGYRWRGFTPLMHFRVNVPPSPPTELAVRAEIP